MKITTFDKNGEPNVVFRRVKTFKIMFVPERLLNLNITFEDGEETDYYLSQDERFAVVEQPICE